jgi:Transposase DDE domain
MSTKRSLVHPKFKTKYHVANWSDYDRSLVERGNITLWLTPAAMASWNAKPTRRRGGQPKYSDVAIETALTLRLLLHLPLRQTEGFLRSIFELMGVSLDVPDHTTMSRRSASLAVSLRELERDYQVLRWRGSSKDDPPGVCVRTPRPRRHRHWQTTRSE